MNRRESIRIGALAGAALVAPSSRLLAVAAGPGPASGDAVAARLRRYSRNVALRMTDGRIHLVASIDDLGAFSDPAVLRDALPYGGIRAEGNRMNFTHQGTRFVVENVMPADFAARAGAIS